jgi:hypothetical protein
VTREGNRSAIQAKAGLSNAPRALSFTRLAGTVRVLNSVFMGRERYSKAYTPGNSHSQNGDTHHVVRVASSGAGFEPLAAVVNNESLRALQRCDLLGVAPKYCADFCYEQAYSGQQQTRKATGVAADGRRAVSKAPRHGVVDPQQFFYRPYPDARTIH